MTDETLLPVDNPISTSEQDVLGRATIARDFARSVRELNSSQGVVVGVLGAWGHGKSSFVNLMREQFAAEPELPVVEFNPWVFSGDQQLTDVFFREIAAELRLTDQSKFGIIAERLDKYGDVLSPLALVPWFGGWFDRTFRATRTAAKWWNERKKGSRTFRERVTESLEQLQQPIVVVIDDIDRLTTAEIRDIFKLVRLTASFPNVIYVLAFDRRRVEQALTEDGVPGRSYLEKILQLSFDLPFIPTEIMRVQVLERLNVVLEDVEDLMFNQDLWLDVFVEIIEPLIVSLRDVSRLGLSARPTLRALGAQIETVDLLALEAVRVFRPEVFTAIYSARVSLTEPQGYYDRGDNAMHKAAIENLLKDAGPDEQLVRALIQRVFPAGHGYVENIRFGSTSADTWKRGHRVAHLGYLDLYFGRTAPTEIVSFRQAELAFARIADSRAFAEYLESIPTENLESVITGLETYQGDYPAEAVVSASTTLLNLIAEIPERRNRGMFDLMRPDVVVTRVVIRLLRQLPDEDLREAAVREILKGVHSYSSQEVLIRSVGRVQDPNNALISAECTAELDDALVESFLSSQTRDPDLEWNLFRVYWFVVERLGDSYNPPDLNDVAEIRSLLQSASSVARAQSGDTRVVREEERLAWDGLVQIAGDEGRLTRAVRRLHEADGETQLVLLAEKYANGWRPEDF